MAAMPRLTVIFTATQHILIFRYYCRKRLDKEINMANLYQDRAWAPVTDADLNRYISLGRERKRAEMREMFYVLFSAGKGRVNNLRRGLARFTQVSSTY
jgi:hypothetical protein